MAVATRFGTPQAPPSSQGGVPGGLETAVASAMPIGKLVPPGGPVAMVKKTMFCSGE